MNSTLNEIQQKPKSSALAIADLSYMCKNYTLRKIIKVYLIFRGVWIVEKKR